MNNYKELNIWQKAMKLVKSIYTIILQLPNEDKFGIISQMRRCPASINFKKSEETSRLSYKEFLYFLEIAYGSSFEFEIQVILSNNLNLLYDEVYAELDSKISELQKMLIGFKNKINNNKVETNHNYKLDSRL